MKAARVHEFGGPIELEDIDPPKLTRGRALVRVVAAGVNPVDWMAREHIYNPKGMDRLPFTLGQDFAGVIERIAPGSRTRLREGDAVFGEVFGAFAEYVSVPVKDLVKKPDELDFVTAASLPMSGLTALQVIKTARARKGRRFLIHGAGGAVGSLAVQLAKLKGAWVAATASAPSIKFLEQVGVDRVIDYKRERFEDVLSDIDVVIEHFGGDIQRLSLAVLRPGGMLINLVGDLDRRALRKARVRGVEFEMKYDVRDLKVLAKLAANGTIRPHISMVFPFRDAPRAIDMNEHNRSHGKIVLRVAA